MPFSPSMMDLPMLSMSRRRPLGSHRCISKRTLPVRAAESPAERANQATFFFIPPGACGRIPPPSGVPSSPLLRDRRTWHHKPSHGYLTTLHGGQLSFGRGLMETVLDVAHQ